MNIWEMILGVVVIGTIGSTLQAWFRARAIRPVAAPEEDTQGIKQEVKTLRERIAVLERIATDRNHLLEQEIESLRDR